MESNGNLSSKCRLIYWSNPEVRVFSWQKVNTDSHSIYSFLLYRQADTGVFINDITPIQF